MPTKFLNFGHNKKPHMKIYTYIIEDERYGPRVQLFATPEARQEKFVADIIKDDRDADIDEDSDAAPGYPSLDILRMLKEEDKPLEEQFRCAVDLYDAIMADGDNDYPFYHNYEDEATEVPEPVTEPEDSQKPAS